MFARLRMAPVATDKSPASSLNLPDTLILAFKMHRAYDNLLLTLCLYGLIRCYWVQRDAHIDTPLSKQWDIRMRPITQLLFLVEVSQTRNLISSLINLRSFGVSGNLRVT